MTGGATAPVEPVTPVFLAIAAALLALSPWLAGLDADLRVALFGAAVLALGLPHGALDTPVARALGLWRTPGGFARFVALYLAVAGAALAAWLAAPGPGLAALLALSAWHFRHDWSGALGVLGGVGVLAWPALWHGGETAAIFALLSTPRAGEALAAGLAWCGVGALALLPLAAWRARVEPRGAREALEIGALAALAAALHPLLFFAAYFCVLHSPRHARDTLRRHGPLVRRQAALVGGCALAAAAAIATAALLAPWPDAPRALVGSVFAGLLCLTVPHVFLVERLEHD